MKGCHVGLLECPYVMLLGFPCKDKSILIAELIRYKCGYVQVQSSLVIPMELNDSEDKVWKMMFNTVEDTMRLIS